MDETLWTTVFEPELVPYIDAAGDTQYEEIQEMPPPRVGREGKGISLADTRRLDAFVGDRKLGATRTDSVPLSLPAKEIDPTKGFAALTSARRNVHVARNHQGMQDAAEHSQAVSRDDMYQGYNVAVPRGVRSMPPTRRGVQPLELYGSENTSRWTRRALDSVMTLARQAKSFANQDGGGSKATSVPAPLPRSMMHMAGKGEASILVPSSRAADVRGIPLLPSQLTPSLRAQQQPTFSARARRERAMADDAALPAAVTLGDGNDTVAPDESGGVLKRGKDIAPHSKCPLGEADAVETIIAPPKDFAQMAAASAELALSRAHVYERRGPVRQAWAVPGTDSAALSTIPRTQTGTGNIAMLNPVRTRNLKEASRVDVGSVKTSGRDAQLMPRPRLVDMKDRAVMAPSSARVLNGRVDLTPAPLNTNRVIEGGTGASSLPASREVVRPDTTHAPAPGSKASSAPNVHMGHAPVEHGLTDDTMNQRSDPLKTGPALTGPTRSLPPTSRVGRETPTRQCIPTKPLAIDRPASAFEQRGTRE